MRANHRGFHARVQDACAKCHPDHAGRAFQLVAWPGGTPKTFDHAQAGWALEGKHAGIECRSCHQPAFQRTAAAKMLRVKDHARSWLGLEQACASCHRDVHQGQLGVRCQNCHGTPGWKPAASFDHARSDYPLTGRHARVECAKCHMAAGLELSHDANGVAIPRYQPLPHAECSACHSDPHRGRFGAKCASCHTTDDFRRVSEKNFDHDRTRYPLRGRHASLECAVCHDPRKAWGAKPAFATCGACHREAHNGLATLAGKATDCASCHDVNGYHPSTFTRAQHQATAYPLEGRHASLECAACHPKQPLAAAATLGPARTALRPVHGRCADCHADTHGTQLAARPEGAACETCHRVAGWRPSRFAASDHERLRFALHGRHREVACASCHGSRRAGLPAPVGAASAGKAGFVFALSERACVACHNDPHRGRFEAGGARPRNGGCLTCHVESAFRPSSIDAATHASTGFPLEGAHRATPCQACHAELKLEPPASTLRLAAQKARALPLSDAPKVCATCHGQPHGNQFATRKDHGACDSCHGVDAWNPALRFDHNRGSAFRLEGVHARAACGACHATERTTEGGRRMIYRPTPSRCEACHSGGVSTGKTGWRPLPRTTHGLASWGEARGART